MCRSDPATKWERLEDEEEEEDRGSATYGAGVVLQLEVDLVLGLLARLGLAEVGRLAEMVAVQLLEEGLVRGLREHALLLKDRQDSHRLKQDTPDITTSFHLTYDVTLFISLFLCRNRPNSSHVPVLQLDGK